MTDAEVDRGVEKLRANVESPNFVYAVGYSLEKVHSGVLCYLLNHHKNRCQLAADLWNRLTTSIEVEEVPGSCVTELTARREKKVGRYAMDLLVEFTDTRTHQVHYIVCEYKVDGSGDHGKQCNDIKEAWNEKKEYTRKPVRFGFVVTGGARFWDPPGQCDEKDIGFTTLKISDVKDLLDPYESVPLVQDYLSALADEEVRGRVAHKLPDKYWHDPSLLGYRGRDWWYAYYDILRHLLPKEMRWSIYNGGHNAVMCWKGSQGETAGDTWFELPHLGSLFCEFNDDSLKLKIAWDKEVVDASNPASHADRFYNRGLR